MNMCIWRCKLPTYLYDVYAMFSSGRFFFLLLVEHRHRYQTLILYPSTYQNNSCIASCTSSVGSEYVNPIHIHTIPRGILSDCLQSPDWQPTLHVAWPSDLVICKYRKEYGHTWDWMSLLRPGVIKQQQQQQNCVGRYPIMPVISCILHFVLSTLSYSVFSPQQRRSPRHLISAHLQPRQLEQWGVCVAMVTVSPLVTT